MDISTNQKPADGAPVATWMAFHRLNGYTTLPREHIDVLAAYLEAGFDECTTASILDVPVGDIVTTLNNIYVKDAVRSLMVEVEKAGMSCEAAHLSYESMLRRAYHIAAGDVKVNSTDKFGVSRTSYLPNVAVMVASAEKLYLLAEKRRLETPPEPKVAGRALPWAKREKALN